MIRADRPIDFASLRELLSREARRLGLPRWERRDEAPQTVAELLRDPFGPLPVWAGCSEGTVWGDPDVNGLFRAIHDTWHRRTGAGFTVADEVALGHAQACAADCDVIRRLTWSEVSGQALYYLEHNDYIPEGAQVSFTLGQLADVDRLMMRS